MLGLLLIAQPGWAVPLTSPSFRLDPDVANTFGGLSSSSSYKLVDSGGEAAVGVGTSASYKLGQGYVAQLEQAIQLNVMSSGVAAYYPLDMGSGTVVYDVSASDSQGTLVNGPTWTNGTIGNAVSFDGTSQYAQLAQTSALSSNSMTASFWFTLSSDPNCDVNNNWRSLLRKTTSTSSTTTGWDLLLEESKNLQFDVGIGGVTSRSGSINVGIALNTPLFITVSYDASSGAQKIYANGVLKSTKSNAPTILGTNASSLDVAHGSNAVACPNGSGYAPGTFDEIKVYSRALSDREVTNEFASSAAGIGSAQTIPNITPDTSQNTSTDLIVRTDAGGYDLAINQDHNLRHTDASTTIAAISAAIASPALWGEGTTKGLGFTVTAGSGLDPKWGSNPSYKYAAIPGSATTFHSRGGYTGSGPELNTLQFRLDTPTTQKSGSYSNTVTITATAKP
jgi:hypothetical protein